MDTFDTGKFLRDIKYELRRQKRFNEKVQRKLNRIERQELNNCTLINWEHLENMMNDKLYQNCRNIQKQKQIKVLSKK